MNIKLSPANPSSRYGGGDPSLLDVGTVPKTMYGQKGYKRQSGSGSMVMKNSKKPKARKV